MPGGDGTGPMGHGSRTGGGFGFCPPGVGPAYSPYPVYGVGRGGLPRGGGRGGGRGWRHWYYATGMPGWARAGVGYPAWSGPAYPFVPQAGTFAPSMTAEQELDALKKEEEFSLDELGQINKRIEQLEAETP